MNPSTATGCPSANVTTPGAPLTSTRRTSKVEAVEDHRASRDDLGAAEDLTCLTQIDAPDHVGVEYFEQRCEVAATGCLQERIDESPLRSHVNVRHRRRSETSAGAAGDLASRLRRTVDDPGDLLEFERNAEDVMQHERQPLLRGQRREHDERREPYRVGDQYLALRFDGVDGCDDGIENVMLDRHFAARLPRAQHVDAHPADDRGQPRTGVADRALLVAG